MSELFARHRDRLTAALDAMRGQRGWGLFAERPEAYGDPREAEQAMRSLLGRRWQPAEAASLCATARGAARAWGRLGVEERVGAGLEVVDRLLESSLDIAQAVALTTPQDFATAWTSAGPAALLGGLEAVALAFEAQRLVPDWQFQLVPRGIALVVGAAGAPLGTVYAALFANLATGNAVILRPDPAAVLPYALIAEVAHAALSEAELPDDAVLLAPEPDAGVTLTMELASRPEIGIVDHPADAALARWLAENARHAQLFGPPLALDASYVAGRFRAVERQGRR